MRCFQEGYDTECTALACTLGEAAARNTIPVRITIFSDAQAAIRRMASDEHGPGQWHALQAREHITTVRQVWPDITIEIRWCAAHKGVAGNEKTDEWAKAAVVQEITTKVMRAAACTRTKGRWSPLPRSLANLRQEISEKK